MLTFPCSLNALVAERAMGLSEMETSATATSLYTELSLGVQPQRLVLPAVP